MSIWAIAWRSVRQRGLASILTIASMALGVALVVLVLSIHGVVTESFRSNSTLGYHLIAGARGGSLQLTLNSVFYLSRPVENVPYEYYLAFRTAEQRRPELQRSIAYRSVRAAEDARELALAGSLGIGGGLQQWLLDEAAAQATRAESTPLGLDQPGMFSNLTGLAIPLCLGDYFREYRVVGTTPDLFDKLVFDPERNRTYTFSEGRNFVTFSEENGYFECVVGHSVARAAGVKIGDRINPVHGDPNDPNAHEHAQSFKVVGILSPTGTPNDRAVFANMEGFFLINDHANPVDERETTPSEEDEELIDLLGSDPPARRAAMPEVRDVAWRPDAELIRGEDAASTDPYAFEPLPIEQREVTSILVLADDELTGGDMAAIHISNMINAGVLEGTLKWSTYRPIRAQRSAQACQPVMEIERLFQTVVEPIQSLLLVLTTMICVVSGISILVSMYNSMSERRAEIAVMRALGANRETIMAIVLFEAVILAAIGGAFGWLGAHTVNVFASPLIEDRTGVSLGFLSIVPAELMLLPGLFILAVLVGLYPAFSAYRTDVSKSLGK
ncbi:MAG TPA: peptide ABC transporter permease [Planctomycetaceae bacterium]|nr:peptide ABC transporter permease [Planctomycetaceae bacterium]HRF00125.1 ABC transporter permease [Pirellulaceae bacterium]